MSDSEAKAPGTPETKAADDPEQDCRSLLGAELFEVLVHELDALPESVDRAALMVIVRQRAHQLRGLALVDPKAQARMVEALENLSQAITRFKSALVDSPWANGVKSRDDFVEKWCAGLERELERIRGEGNFLVLSMKQLGWVSPRGGRPRNGIGAHVAALGQLGLSVRDATALFDRVGLGKRGQKLARGR